MSDIVLLVDHAIKTEQRLCTHLRSNALLRERQLRGDAERRSVETDSRASAGSPGPMNVCSDSYCLCAFPLFPLKLEINYRLSDPHLVTVQSTI